MGRTSIVGIVMGALLVGAVTSAMAQVVDSSYGTSVERGIVYGTSIGFDGRLDTLRTDVWKPRGDGDRHRPLVVWLHAGGFTGGMTSDMDKICEAFAARGYVAASVDYRVGFYAPTFLQTPYAFDSNEIIRAWYRGVQDLHGALRFLTGRADADRIDVDRCVIGGVSAGAIVALQCMYVDASERPPATVYAAPIVVPMGEPIQRNDLGPLEGTLHLDQRMPRVVGVVSMLGAVDDTAWIDTDDIVALYQYQQRNDPVVPCGRQRGLWGLPFDLGANYQIVFGACAIEEHLLRRDGLRSDRRSWIMEGHDHGLHDQHAVIHDIASFLFTVLHTR